MKIWLIPSNGSKFRIGDAIHANGGILDWRVHCNYEVGDIAYFYKTRPYQCIGFKMVVVKVNLSLDEAIDQKEYWTDQHAYVAGLKGSVYARFKLLEEIEDHRITLAMLKSHGLKGNLQGARKVYGELLNFIESVLQTKKAD